MTATIAMAEPDSVRTVQCPQCGAPVRWEAASRWRPFCSERCKTLDLGAWAAEAYRVPAVELDDVDLDADLDAGDTPGAPAAPAKRRP